MKRTEFVRLLERAGCHLLLHGGRHDIYLNPQNHMKQPIPRHAEIHDKLAAHIWKYLGLDEDIFKR